MIKNPWECPNMVKIFLVSVGNEGKRIRYETLSGKIMERLFDMNHGNLLKEWEIIEKP
jgi:hypothetical protein